MLDSNPCMRAKTPFFCEGFEPPLWYCLPPPMETAASCGVGCDAADFGWTRFSSGRRVGRLAHITAIANSTELQFAMPTRVHVGFALSMEKRE